MYIHLVINPFGNNPMKELFEQIKSEFKLLIARLDSNGTRKNEKIDQKVAQEIEDIGLKYPYPQQAREYIKGRYTDAYFFANIVRNYDINSYLYWAMLNFHWGEHEWELGQHSEGIGFMVQATRGLWLWQGYLEGLGRREYQESVLQKRKINGSEGGIERAGRYQPVKDELISLLKKEMPETGWKTKREAVDAIEPKLWRFIDGHYRKAFDKENIRRRKAFEPERKPFSMVRENLDRTILDWSRNDETIKAAFLQVILKGR